MNPPIRQPTLMAEFRCLIAERVMGWILILLPEGEMQAAYARAVTQYFQETSQ
jgi:hypothetical protein